MCATTHSICDGSKDIHRSSFQFFMVAQLRATFFEFMGDAQVARTTLDWKKENRERKVQWLFARSS
jgi:hypothetical protein